MQQVANSLLRHVLLFQLVSLLQALQNLRPRGFDLFQIQFHTDLPADPVINFLQRVIPLGRRAAERRVTATVLGFRRRSFAKQQSNQFFVREK